MPKFAAEALVYMWKKKTVKNITPVGIEPGSLITSDSKSNTFLSGLSWYLLLRLKTIGSLYSNALLILTKSSKCKNQVVHEQKLKDRLRSTCQVSSKRIDFESEAMRDLGSIPTGVTFFTGFFVFS